KKRCQHIHRFQFWDKGRQFSHICSSLKNSLFHDIMKSAWLSTWSEQAANPSALFPSPWFRCISAEQAIQIPAPLFQLPVGMLHFFSGVAQPPPLFLTIQNLPSPA